MDNETLERVLQKTIDLSEYDNLDEPVTELLKHLPDLTDKVILGCLYEFKRLGLVHLSTGDETIGNVEILDSAIGYLRKAKEVRKIAKSKKWDDRRWNITQALIIGSASYILGIISMWLLNKIKIM